ncbi:MAG TPA: efflux RND transporter periplasmic adaptor subunit [Candidatus Dormibacteraeota bacterium]|nr:efflux RND transporter periplasmic adaptor subunit [Candidatus Dormibacteraeota bacterium]
MKRRTAWVAGIIVVTAVGALAALSLGGGRGKAGTAKYETVKVERGKIVAKVTASGTLSALVTVQVGTQVSGRIQDLYVDFNSPVHKGEVLAKIDPQFFKAAVEQAKANLVAAEGNLAKAKAQAADAHRQYVRAKSLVEQGQLIAQSDLDTADANAQAADAQVQAMDGQVAQARATLYQADVNLGYTTITSSIDGTVISRNVDVGQTVAASLQAPTLFTIAQDLKKMQVDTNVSEADVGKLSPGMRTSFNVDAFPGENFKGVIRQIRNSPQSVQNVVTYDAVIDVDNPDLRLRPGMTANVTFTYAEKDDALRFPNAALRFRPPAEIAAKAPRPERDRRVLWVLRDGAPVPVAIKTGLSDGSVTEIADGDLQEGDALVTEAVTPGSGVPPAFRRPL